MLVYSNVINLIIVFTRIVFPFAAMVACPVGSIRTHVSDPLVKQVMTEVFPAEIDPVRIPGVNLQPL